MYLDEVTMVQVRHKQKGYYGSRLTDPVSDQQTEPEESCHECVLYEWTETTISENPFLGAAKVEPMHRCGKGETNAWCGETYFQHSSTEEQLRLSCLRCLW